MKLIAIVSLLIALALSALDCKPASGPLVDAEAGAALVEAGTTIATGLCTVLEGIDSTGTLRTICATIEEIAAIAAFVLTLRSLPDAGPPKAGEACQLLGSSTVCATSAERAAGILRVINQRAARFMLDAGAARLEGGAR
jgi:hypothetical protein